MKKRALSLLVTALLVLGLAVPALAADYTVPDHSWVGCSNECIRTESYTTSYGWDKPLYIFPAGTKADSTSYVTKTQCSPIARRERGSHGDQAGGQDKEGSETK